MKTAIAFSLLLACAVPALAQTPAAAPPDKTAKSDQAKPAKPTKPAKTDNNGSAVNLFGSHNSNAPINVSSDNFVGDLATKIGTYIGNVLVIQGDMRMRADTMKVNVNQGKPTRIEANGKVVVTAPNGTATGDNGVYELGPRTITMTGHVVLTKEKDVMRGTKLVMDMNTNLAHLYAQGMPGNRVQGLFIPPPQQQNPSATGGKGKGKKAGSSEEMPARVQQTINTDGSTPPPAQ
ncbi:MAG TPA: LptA/OstA family protein [Rhizomicrobium sp.]|jgi:lipopolysaccharide export system protein LptA|nr:LptA/OstA family protein [Rhizomicrobium sp.]